MERFLISSEHIRAPGQPESRVKISCTHGDALCGTKGSQECFQGSYWGPVSRSQGFLWVFGEVRRLAMHSEGSPEQAGCTPPALSLLGGIALPRPAGGLPRACDQWAPCSEEPCAWVNALLLPSQNA